MILTVTLNPSVDRAIYLAELKLGDTNRIERTETDAGGKGINLARVADELGANTLATGFLGGVPGAFVRTVLDREGVPHDFVEVAGDTRINFSVEDVSGNPPTTFNERGPEVDTVRWGALLAKCREHAPKAGWACMGGSVPPGIGPDAYKTLGKLFKEAGCSVIIDADGDALRQGLESGPDLVKPNSKEAERLLGYPVATDDEAIRAAIAIQAMGSRMVLLSRGEKGAVLAAEGIALIGKSPSVEPRSSIGSGDSMLGAFLWALEEQMPLSECLIWGLAAGAATATTGGSEIARQSVIERLLPLASVK